MTATLHSVALRAAAALCACLALPAAWSQTSAQALAPAAGIAHTVQPGDTLEALARAYLDAPRQWHLLQRHNAVADPRRLPIGSVLHIPAHLLPRTSASVEFVQGDVQATPAAQADQPQGPAHPLQAGAPLPEGTRLQVGSESFITVRLADGSVLRVQAQSDLRLQQMRRKGRAGSLQSVIEMHGGSLDAVVPRTPDPARRLEIRTPRATTSVRGTQFGVALSGSGQTSTSVLEGSVAVQAHAFPAAQDRLLQPGEGVAVSAEGALGAVQPLLPAPDLSTVPERLGDAALVHLALPSQAGAHAYQVQLAPFAAPTQVLRNGVFADGAVRFRAVPDGRYVLSARALDAAGIAGRVAQRALAIKTQPVAPLYQSPSPGATVASSGESLHCTGVAGAQWYHLQVARSADFAALVRDAPRQSQCRLDTGALPTGAYHWRVASVRQLADGSIDTGPFAAPQAFTVADRPAALADSALHAQASAGALRLHWPGLPGQSYRLQCARDLAFTDTVCDTALQQPEWQATGLPAGRYYVRLQTLDASGLRSDFSVPRHIDIGTGLQTGDGGSVHAADGQPVGLD